MISIILLRNWSLTFTIYPTNTKCVSRARGSVHITQANDRPQIHP